MTETHSKSQEVVLRSLTYPHVEVSPLLSTVVQHQVGVSIEESAHLGGIQLHRLHLLHPPHPQALLPNLWAELARRCLEGEHAARRDENRLVTKIKW